MSFTPFIKPYPDGYEDFEVGGTPVTAEILNNNYDGFLLALNGWASDAENDIGDAKSDITGLQGNISSIQSALNNKVDTSTFNQLGDAVRQIGLAVNSKSTVSISDLLQSGTKVATLTIDGTQYDLYAPSGGGGGSSVAWNQIISTGTKIATVTIDGVPTDVYVPTPIDELSNLTDVSITNLQNGQILKWNSTTLKWENSNESGGGTGGHTIIDENGNSMTARAGLQFVGAKVSDDATNNKTIVDMSGGGVYIEKTLWEDANGLQFAPNNIQTVTLSESLNKYDFIYVDVSALADTEYHNQNILAVSSLYDENDGYNGVVCIGGDINRASSFAKVDNTHLKFIGFSSANPLIVWKVVGIKVSGDYYASVIYSTEEREIGVWTDGKPLYENTLELSSIPSTSPISIDVSALNIDVMASAIGEVYAISNGVIVETMVLPAYISQSYYGAIRFLNDNVQILHTGLGDYSSGKITIQYTKTTDVAGSGSWTPQGVPAVHYSTDEHIIGTWIDGKTLYEKTIDFGAIPNNTTKSVAHGINNLSMVVSWNGCMKSSDSFETVPSGENSNFKLTADATNISIRTSTSWNDWTVSYITIQYTKSS